MSMDKGGLTEEHCQIVPVEHVPSFAGVPDLARDGDVELHRRASSFRALADKRLVVFGVEMGRV